MSDLLREEFDAWFSVNAPDINNLAAARVAKHMMIKELAFLTWQASRECLVVELPKTAGLDRMASDMSMQEIREDNRFNRALDLAKKSLTAAGVKTK